jgi:hypothetical protein
MTLVVSDLSRHGIIMLGDSAVVSVSRGIARSAPEKANKVHYFQKANIGAAIWGIRSIGDDNSDQLLRELVQTHDSADLSLETCGQLLADTLNAALDQAGVSGKDREGGIHLGGYVLGYPKLWHVHWCASGSEGRWALAKDFPESKGLSDTKMESLLSEGGSVQLANGFYRYLNVARECLKLYSILLQLNRRHRFPEDTIDGRIIYVRTLFMLVPAALKSTIEPLYVDENIRLVAFDKSGCIKGPLRITLEEDSLDG